MDPSGHGGNSSLWYTLNKNGDCVGIGAGMLIAWTRLMAPPLMVAAVVVPVGTDVAGREDDGRENVR